MGGGRASLSWYERAILMGKLLRSAECYSKSGSVWGERAEKATFA